MISAFTLMRSSEKPYTDLFAKAGRFLLDRLAPPLCPVTNEPLGRAGGLSPPAWEKIRFIDDPVCARCGAPFAVDYGPGAECAGCLADPPAFDSARAAVIYDDACHALIVGFKHSDRTDLAPLLAGWLARAGAGLVTTASVLAPVPLHPRRLFARRFNQSALLAHRLSRMTGAVFAPTLFERLRPTPSQKGLSADQRRRNLAGAIGVRSDAAKDAHVVIIDDVMTTGATLSACARAARKAGARRVDALVLARALKGGVVLG